MATLAISLAGAGIGTSLGLTAAQGFLIGSVIGNLLFPPPPIVTEGPRLGDTSVTASTYGKPIPLGYGTIRLGGNVIWSSGIIETKNKQKIGGKGGLGGPSQVQITYTYSASFAIAFSATEAERVTKIWADSKLIYDASGTEFTRKEGLNFRFYKGTESQVPDGLIEADKGEGQVPGHRGLSYIVFDDLQLEDFGNRIPNITAEIAFKSINSNPFTNFAPITDGEVAPDEFRPSTLAFDPDSRTIYTVFPSQPGGSFIRVFSMAGHNEVRQVQVDSTNFNGASGGQMYFAPFARILMANVGFTGNTPLAGLDPDTLQPRWITSENLFNTPAVMAEILADSALGDLQSWTLVTQLNTANLRIVQTPTGDVRFDNVNENGDFTQDIFGIVQDEIAFSPSALIGVKNNGNSDLELFKVTFSTFINGDTGKFAGSPNVELIKTFSSSLWNNEASNSATPMGPFKDPLDGGILFVIELTDSRIFIWKWNPIDDEIVWSNTVDGRVAADGVSTNQVPGTIAFNNNTTIKNGRLGWVDDTRNAILFDTLTGEIIVERTTAASIGATYLPNGAGFYDPETESIINLTENGSVGGEIGPVNQLYIGRSSGLGIPLSFIVEDVSSRVGLDPATDLDTTVLTDNVRGFVAAQSNTARQILEPLMTAFFVQGVESDFKIKFVKRGGSSVVTIPQKDLVPLDDNGEILTEQRTQEVELPERMNVQFMDIDSDFQQGTQSTKRILKPNPSMRSQSEQSISLPIVFNVNEAKQISEMLLFSSWNERTNYTFRLPQKYLYLDSSDNIDILLDNGTRLKTRISSNNIDTSLSINIEAISESGSTFSSSAIGSPSLGVPQKLPPASGATKLTLMNLPILRDIDEVTGAFSKVYFGMGGYTSGWREGNLFQSLDEGQTYDFVERAIDGTDFGVLSNALPDTNLPFQTDTETVLKVIMTSGELVAVTDQQFLNNTNVAAVGSPTTQNWEIIAYRDVTQVGPQIYEVSHILRARRGTEPFVGTHQTGESFIPLTVDTINTFILNASLIDTQLPYKAVGSGKLLENVRPVGFTGLGRDKAPYAPVHLNATPSGNDVNLSWVRRTRVGGELNRGGFTPLSETSELYELEILNPGTGAVVRTETGLTSPSFTYTSAQQTTDGFSPPMSQVRFRVYQISEVVGRGYPGEATQEL